jgi:hypothetical protein
MASCRGCSELLHVAAELLNEGRLFCLLGGWHQELPGDTYGLSIDELCCARLMSSL